MNFDFSPAWISIKVTLIATVINFFLGLSIAWLLTNYKGKWKGLIDGILTLPLVLPPTVVGFGILLLVGKNGPIGNFLEIFGVNIIFSWYAAVLAAIVVAFPLMYKTSMGAFEQVDPNVLSAARTLGASEWKVFWRVAVPVARPGIAAATALTFARSLGEFGATLMVAGSIPGKTETIPIAIYFATSGGEMQVALIWVLIIFVISLSVLVINNYWESYKKKERQGFGG
ncbi:MAG: molybdate ABC transporter permease subunit [Acetobacterium woodii]|nr:molybdate ABC transporter permease subunit [Acetobacterium woodii]